jgi:predicted dehydrogenase
LKVKPGSEPLSDVAVTPLRQPHHDPFAYFAGVVRGEIKIQSTDLSSVENNLIVMEILEAAKESATTGKRVSLAGDK